MLYQLLYTLSDTFGFLNVVKYITFRGMLAILSAMVISFIISPWFIRKLRSNQIGQQVRKDGPESHFSKSGTPTMGGAMILTATIIPALLWMDWSNPMLWYVLIITAGYGGIGFIDDYLKVSKKNTKGLSGWFKLAYNRHRPHSDRTLLLPKS